MHAGRHVHTPRPQLSVEEAAALLSRLADTVERLTGVVVEETRLVRSGAYQAARALEGEKGALSSRYMLDVGAVSGAVDAIAVQPREQLDEMERMHAAFRTALDENLAVLGTARSVAESLLRGVSEEIGGRAAPKTYDARGGAYGRPAAAPMALSRTS
ncbi:hypothetical protein ACFSCV_15710 [Methylopila henanensis]|uniref:Flagellar basal-body protein FlbY n=1 Tax=Methylopila henanensis TaxID=873516 RepID=A0ABW4KAZ2_9HYPH